MFYVHITRIPGKTEQGKITEIGFAIKWYNTARQQLSKHVRHRERFSRFKELQYV